MLDFTNVENEMVNDLKEKYLQHYFLLNKNALWLPKEVNLIIAYNMILNSNEYKILQNRKLYFDKLASHFLIVHVNRIYHIKLLPNQPDINEDYRITYNVIRHSPLIECLDILYQSTNDVFDKLMKDCLNIRTINMEDVLYQYKRFYYHADIKIPQKYIHLIKFKKY